MNWDHEDFSDCRDVDQAITLAVMAFFVVVFGLAFIAMWFWG